MNKQIQDPEHLRKTADVIREIGSTYHTSARHNLFATYFYVFFVPVYILLLRSVDNTWIFVPCSAIMIYCMLNTLFQQKRLFIKAHVIRTTADYLDEIADFWKNSGHWELTTANSRVSFLAQQIDAAARDHNLPIRFRYEPRS